MSKPTPAVFLDRDGVINASPGTGYVRSWEEFAFLPGTLEAIRDLHRAGFRLVVVSNQRGIAQRLYSQAAVEEITTRMTAAVMEAGGALDAVFYCAHLETAGCACRKPQRGMIDQACARYPTDLSRSFMVGDDLKDILLGQATGCRTILVLSGRTGPEAPATWARLPDQICQDLRAAADWILAQAGDSR